MARSTLNYNGPSSQSLQIAKSLRSKGIESLFVSSGGPFVKNIEDSDFKFVTVKGLSHTNHKLPIVIKTIFKLRKIINLYNPNLIHGHNAAATILCFIAGLSCFKILPCFTSVGGLKPRKTYRYRNLIWLLVPGKLFAVCNVVKERLISFGVNNSKIVVTYNGVDTNKFKFSHSIRKKIRNEFKLEDSIVLVIVGKPYINPMTKNIIKGHNVLLEAHYKLLKRFPNLRVMMIGDGDGLNYLKELSNFLICDEYDELFYIFF